MRKKWQIEGKWSLFRVSKQRCSWLIHEDGLWDVRKGALGGYSSSSQPQCSAMRSSIYLSPSRTSYDNLDTFTNVLFRSRCWGSQNTLRNSLLCLIFYFFFSFFICLFHIAYSQQFIHSTVIIVLTLQTRRVRHCSSPVRRSCIKVHNKQKFKSFFPHVSVNIIDICICLNIHLYILYICHNL